ncbi:hypothetical protein PHMEG_00015081 [Phytophthora megakarya]|uniref:Uncharacterized protein n=1 Tax=Phytophthora megakarya TaxID=4795 RepID=A0A225W496_9STRA|nr:hypothetical protein PHMEG_00015081 [Phytophthora megakarya]
MPQLLQPDTGQRGEDGGSRPKEDDKEEQQEQLTTVEEHERQLADERMDERGSRSSKGEANDKEQRASATSEQGKHEGADEKKEPRYGSESEAEAASITGDDEQSQDEKSLLVDKQGEAGEEASQASSTEEAKLAKSKTEIPTAEIWTALVSALKAHPKGTYLVEWKSTVKALFKVEHERLPIRSHLVPQQKQRYPNLTDAEVTHLLEFIAVAQEKEQMHPNNESAQMDSSTSA